MHDSNTVVYPYPIRVCLYYNMMIFPSTEIGEADGKNQWKWKPSLKAVDATGNNTQNNFMHKTLLGKG